MSDAMNIFKLHCKPLIEPPCIYCSTERQFYTNFRFPGDKGVEVEINQFLEQGQCFDIYFDWKEKTFKVDDTETGVCRKLTQANWKYCPVCGRKL